MNAGCDFPPQGSRVNVNVKDGVGGLESLDKSAFESRDYRTGIAYLGRCYARLRR